MTIRSHGSYESRSSLEMNAAEASSFSLAAPGTSTGVRAEPRGSVPRWRPARLSTRSLMMSRL